MNKIFKYITPEKVVLFGLLIGLGIAFLFPFLWMLGTSMKSQEEMSQEQLGIMPAAPRPVIHSPYIDQHTFREIETPDGVAAQLWEACLPELNSLLEKKLAANPPAADGTLFQELAGTETYKQTMLAGIFNLINLRLSDEARQKAWEVDHNKNRKGKLSEAAVSSGRKAIVEAVDKLITAEIISQLFDRSYRRFCLGSVRAQKSDYTIVNLSSPDNWNAETSNTLLLTRPLPGNTFQAADINFSESDEASFLFKPAQTGKELERFFVKFRSDSSWARIWFELVLNGKVYRTSEVVNLCDSNWSEVELRLSMKGHDKMARRAFYLLEETDKKAPEGVNFAVRAVVEQNSTVGAWWDKMLRNYRIVFREIPFTRYIMTSLAVCVLNIVLAIFSCTLTAYAFTCFDWPGRNMFFGIMLATMMLPPQVMMIPTFLIARHLGWYNSLIPMWIYSAFGSAFFIFLLRQYFKSIPKDLIDAAKIDGCGFLKIYWNVILPLVKPTVATIAIFSFIWTWNNFMTPLIYVNDDSLFPLALGLFKFQVNNSFDVGLMMAGSFVMTLPIIILFFFCQRYFIQGITLTGTKG